jgi:hypothetical protein
VEACGERLGGLLPSAPARWRFGRVTLRGVPTRPVPGHPDAAALLARLSCQPGAAVTPDNVAADLQARARTRSAGRITRAARGAAHESARTSKRKNAPIFGAWCAFFSFSFFFRCF